MEALTFHLFSRGAKKTKLFQKDEDCQRFFCMVAEFSESVGIKFYAAVAMPNHFHFLPAIGTQTPKMSKFMHRLCTGYAMYYNYKYKESGHVFQGTFGRTPRAKVKNVLWTMRYISQNPIELARWWKWSKAVSFMRNYEWSSYRMFFEAQAPGWLDVEGSLRHFRRDLSMFQKFMESPEPRL